jgi:1-phosphatidylinositol-3-phosphate 5-kinase
LANALGLLTKMRLTFQRIEQDLYGSLHDTPDSTLNNVRRLFHSAGVGSMRRLSAWEAKHLSKNAKDELSANRKAIPQPSWWEDASHAVPGSSVVIKEDDWGSIIAFTLR